MTAPVSEIVKVNITRESVNISRVGFGTMLILGNNANFAARVQYFEDLASVGKALLSGTLAPEYKAASAAFSQNPKVERIAIGHRVATVTAIDNAGTFTAGSIKATVNGVLKTQVFITDKDTTLTALAAQIATVAGVSSCTYDPINHRTIIVPVTSPAGVPVGLSIDITGITGTMLFTSYTTTDDEDADVALSACQQENNDWYGVILASRIKGDVLDAAEWVEAAELKFFATASADSDIVNKTVDLDTSPSIAKTFMSKGYLKSTVIYNSYAETEYPDAALLGRIFPYDPGSYTACFKTLVGIDVDNLDATQRANAFAKFVNVYEYVGGVNILRQGTVSGNEYIDIMIFIDWLDARCTEAVFGVLAASLKVPYTDPGIHSIYNALTQPLQAGQNAGGISPTAYNDQKKQIGGFYITVPRLQDVAPGDKTARELHNVKFVAYLAGAIQKVYVDGTVTVIAPV